MAVEYKTRCASNWKRCKMMLIKYMITVYAEIHRIISTIRGQNKGNISTYIKIYFLPCYNKLYGMVYKLR